MKIKSWQPKKLFISLALFALFFAFFSAKTEGQDVVDKTVATVGDGLGSPELITYSDLLWQLALEPGVSIRPPSSDDLNRALQTLLDQRLFALEAKRVPRTEPSEEEVNTEIKRVLAQFPSIAEFEERLRTVGFDSVKDDNFERIMADRVKIEKYLDFRFRAFVVITPEDEAKYYRETYTRDFRRLNPTRLLPKLDEVRSQINQALSEKKVASDIRIFLEDAKNRTEIIILSEV